MEELYPEIFKLSQEGDGLRLQVKETKDVNKHVILSEQIAITTAKLSQKQQLFYFYEGELAKLEHREPREIELDFSKPQPPTVMMSVSP